jgi:hypothetical protein
MGRALFDRVVAAPLWERRLAAGGGGRRKPTPLHRVGLGHAPNVASMAVAAVVERRLFKRNSQGPHFGRLLFAGSCIFSRDKSAVQINRGSAEQTQARDMCSSLLLDIRC